MIKLSRKVLCLDWDRRALRIVVAQMGGEGLSLEDAHAHRIPQGVDVEDAEALGTFIGQQLARHHIKLNRAILSVPRDRTVLNRLQLPPTPEPELAAAVRFQAMRELPFPLEEAQIDFVVTQTNEEGMATEVLLAAVRNEVLEHLKATCTAAGLVPARVGLRPYACMTAVAQLPAVLDRTVLFVDVGPAASEIDVIAAGGMLAFSRAANVLVPYHGGDYVLGEAGEEPEATDEQRTAAVEATAISELLLEITRTLQAFRATAAGAVIDQIVVGGGTGIEPALLEAIEERFEQPATLFDPTAALGVDAGEAEKLGGFAAPLGLAWGLGRDGRLALDFLNPKRPVPRGEILKRRLQIGGAVAAVILLGVTAWGITDFVQRKNLLEELRAENAKLRKEALEFVNLDIRCREADEWEAISDGSVWLDHLYWITQQAVEPGKKMVITSIDFNATNNTINLKFVCTDWEVANQFAKRLNEFRDPKGKQIYRVDQGKWAKSKTVDPKFQQRVDCRIELLELSKRPDIKERKRTYRKLKRMG